MALTSLSLALVTGLLLFLLAQAGLARRTLRVLREHERPRLEDADCPRAAVLLCLRGRDPYLEACLARVLDLDYPDYEVRVVLDHDEDPSRACVEAARRGPGGQRLRVEVLRERLPSGSLKGSSLVQAVGGLDASFEVVAMLDSDVVVHPTWLRELVAPLRQPGVGAATGNRWYMPEPPTVGALVRALWNAAAVVQMHAAGTPWGGTLAMRRALLLSLGLPDRWRRSLSVDTVFVSALREHGLRLAFVPSLMMPNRESCALGPCLRWMRRQMLASRLYHPRWGGVLLHAITTALLPALALAAAGAALAGGRSGLAALLLGGLASYAAGLGALLLATERAVRRVLAARGERTRWLTPRACLGLPIAALCLQVLYPAALLSAQTARRVTWRGVEYRIDGPWRIRLTADAPYRPRERRPGESL